MATKPKITPKGGLKVIVLDNNGQPRVLGTIPIWENPSAAQKWAIQNSGCELSAQLVYVAKEEEFTLEGEVSLKTNSSKIINTKYKVSIKES